jgi:hypothetical protein
VNARRGKFRRLALVAAALVMSVGVVAGASDPTAAASASTSATYYRDLTVFTTVRAHYSGAISWENLGGTTYRSDGTTSSTYCGGAAGDKVQLRYPENGSAWATTYFSPTSYSWKSFPSSSYDYRKFAMAFQIQGACGAGRYETARYVWGTIHY